VKVAFDARPASEMRGIGRYTRSLLAALHDVAVDRGGEVIDRGGARGVDVLHAPWMDGAPLRPRVPTVVTLHEVMALKRPGEYLRSGLRYRMRYLAVKRAAQVIVPTRAVASEATEKLRLPADRVHVVHEAHDGVFVPRTEHEIARVRRRYDLPPRYLVWVGCLRHPDPRRRIGALAEAVQDVPLVLVGEAAPWTREIEGVTLTGAVPDDDLAAIYSGAVSYVCPSEDEGFGLAPVEALACGTPVVACDIPALREVLDSRATFVPAGDLDALVAAAERARRPAPAPPPWTWSDAAQATWEVYERALADGA